MVLMHNLLGPLVSGEAYVKLRKEQKKATKKIGKHLTRLSLNSSHDSAMLVNSMNAADFITDQILSDGEDEENRIYKHQSVQSSGVFVAWFSNINSC